MARAKVDAATTAFIREARKVHGKRYDYSRSAYQGSETKLTIVCRNHGAFQQSPYVHVKVGCGCNKCGEEQSGQKQIARAAKAFLSKAHAIHGDRYDYSKAEYKNAHAKVCIICRHHGEFWQSATSHLSKNLIGCPECGKLQRGLALRDKAAKTFQEKAKKAHGDRYDYSQVRYVRATEKVIIACPTHGPFLQTPHSHLGGAGCPGCKSDTLRRRFSMSHKEFVRKARIVHGRRYRYVEQYVNTHTPIAIECREHGKFRQEPASHLSGNGCPICGGHKLGDSKAMNHAEFLAKARKMHKGAGYTYPDRYVRAIKKITIRCRKHGSFKQTPFSHLNGNGCPECAAVRIAVKNRLSHREFLKRARRVHGDRFSYPEQYFDTTTPITIVCRKHGEFKQWPVSHWAGSGCPTCTESNGEAAVALELERMGVRFERQKSFPDCRSIKPLRFDFFVPEYNTLIEYDGPQHFQPIEHWGGDAAFQIARRRDEIKSRWARRKNIQLIRIPYTEKDIADAIRSGLA